MEDAPIACGDAEVTGLLRFVGARLEQDRLDPASTDEASFEACDLVDQLLEAAAATCDPEFPCVLPGEHIAALALFAVLHESHPDFNPEWLRRLSGEVDH